MDLLFSFQEVQSQAVVGIGSFFQQDHEKPKTLLAFFSTIHNSLAFHLRTHPLMVAIWLPQSQASKHSKARNGGLGLGVQGQTGRKRPSVYTPLVFYQEQNPSADFPFHIIGKNGITFSSLSRPEAKVSLPNI